MREPKVTLQGTVRVRRSCLAPIAQAIEHRQGFFLQIQAGIGQLQVSGQATLFFFKLFNTSLVRCPGRRWPGGALTQSGHAIFCECSSSIGELMAIQLFTTQKGSEFAVFAGFGFGEKAQLVFRVKCAACAFFQHGVWCHLRVESS